MLKKRLNFALFWDQGFFIQSRNFRRQRVGTIDWLLQTYGIKNIVSNIDELLILNISKGEFDFDNFRHDIETLTQICFTPVCVGGRIDSYETAKVLFGCGVDKIVMNTGLIKHTNIVRMIARDFGAQSIVAAVDFQYGVDGKIRYLVNHGADLVDDGFSRLKSFYSEDLFGELFLNSIDRDGTGQGLDFRIFDSVDGLKELGCPIIMCGGIGKYDHVIHGLDHGFISGVCTGNLLNFVGSGLSNVRQRLTSERTDVTNITSVFESKRV